MALEPLKAPTPCPGMMNTAAKEPAHPPKIAPNETKPSRPADASSPSRKIPEKIALANLRPPQNTHPERTPSKLKPSPNAGHVRRGAPSPPKTQQKSKSEQALSLLAHEPEKPTVSQKPFVIAFTRVKSQPATQTSEEQQALKAASPPTGTTGMEPRHSTAAPATESKPAKPDHTADSPDTSKIATTEKNTPEAHPPTSGEKPGPSAARHGNGAARWRGKLLGRLERFRRYPEAARKQHQEGVVRLRFCLDRQGHVLSARIEGSSGVTTLDEEALALVRRADPLPSPPEDVSGERIELVVPVQFFLK